MRLLHLAQALVFVTTLTLEVRVRAAEDIGTVLSLPKDTALIEIPEHCTLDADRCALKTSARGKYKFPVGRAEVVMSNNTSLVKGTAGGITFVSGTIWVRAPQAFTVETEFGEIHSVASSEVDDINPGEPSEFWIIHRDGKIWAQAITNSVYLRPRGGSADIKLDAGEELWMGGVQKNGIAMTGIAQPIYFPDFAHQWALVYPGSRKSFKISLEKVEVLFKKAAENIAGLQGGLVQRQIASEKQDLKAKQERDEQLKAKTDAHERIYRDLFRRKVLGY